MYLNICNVKNSNKLQGVFVLDTKDMIVEFLQASDYRKIRKKIYIHEGSIDDCREADLANLRVYNDNICRYTSIDHLDLFDKSWKARLIMACPSTDKDSIRYIVKIKCTSPEGYQYTQDIGVGIYVTSYNHRLVFVGKVSKFNQEKDKGFVLRTKKLSGWQPVQGYIVVDIFCPFLFIKQVFMDKKADFLKSFFDGEILEIQDLGSFVDVRNAIPKYIY